MSILAIISYIRTNKGLSFPRSLLVFLKIFWVRLNAFFALCFKCVKYLDQTYQPKLYSQSKKQRHHFAKAHIVKAMVFPVAMYRCKGWTIKKAEHQRIDAFEMWCWRRLLRVPWTARRLNQSILKEINPECPLEGLMLKLRSQYFGHLMWRAVWKRPWCWERMNAGREGDHRRQDGWMTSLTQWTWVWASAGSWWWTRNPGMLQSMR